MLTLEGRGAIVAGTRRVGGVVVERLAREGVKQAILYRSSREAAEEQARRFGGVAIQADLTDEASVKHAVGEARNALGDLSFCINLAYDYPRASFDKLDAAAWDHGLSGAKATFLLALHAARAMFENPGPTRGHLVFFGDWAANETPYLDYLPYLAGKAAVHFLTRGFAMELASHGILVNAILPGPTARPPDLSQAGWDQALAQTPLHRESSDDEIAEMIATLLRLETITGENIRIDAGRHIAGTAERKPST
ncbi:MAG TPA: SDR family oxidoreductase [Dehalococcoidia bacterium]|jgi:3-oxoacyl-[acyl-carrier protein] reductase|nr:SDR family oxidoreductase [Dehalococcoidia bacterium]